MVSALQTPVTEHPHKRIIVDPALESFKNLLPRAAIDSWSSQDYYQLHKDEELWLADVEYQYVNATASSMKIVNDIGEWEVALMDEYNKLHINKDE